MKGESDKMKNKKLLALLTTLSLQCGVSAKQDELKKQDESKIIKFLKCGAYTTGGLLLVGSIGTNLKLIEENKRLKRVNNKFNGNDEAEEAMK